MVKDEFIEFNPRKQKTALILALTLVLCDFTLNIYFAVIKGFSIHLLTSMIPCIMMGVYALTGYLKPHGSKIKTMFLFKAVFIGLNVCSSTYVHSFTTPVLICVVVATAYMAGRLNKIRSNARIMVVISLVFLVIIVAHTFVYKDAQMMADTFNHFIQWIALACIYYGRFEEHRNAGIEYDIRNFGPELQSLLLDLWNVLTGVNKKDEDNEKISKEEL